VPKVIKSYYKKSGPTPTCLCGDCPKCHNRLRQQRFARKQKEMKLEEPKEAVRNE